MHSRAILARNKRVGFKLALPVSDETPPKDLTTNIRNPYDGQPITPRVLTNLYFYLLSVREFTPRRQKETYYREAKLLIDQYGGPRAVDLMLSAAKHCQNLWGFPYLNRLAEQKYNGGLKTPKRSEQLSPAAMIANLTNPGR